MTHTANIEVYHDGTDVFGVLTESDMPTVDDDHDLPEGHLDDIDQWANEEYSHLESGESVENAGTLVYENGEIVEIRKSE